MTAAQRRLEAKAAVEAAKARRDTRRTHEARESLKAATTALLRQEARKPWWRSLIDFAGWA